jgi:hypothetical protein
LFAVAHLFLAGGRAILARMADLIAKVGLARQRWETRPAARLRGWSVRRRWTVLVLLPTLLLCCGTVAATPLLWVMRMTLNAGRGVPNPGRRGVELQQRRGPAAAARRRPPGRPARLVADVPGRDAARRSTARASTTAPSPSARLSTDTRKSPRTLRRPGGTPARAPGSAGTAATSTPGGSLPGTTTGIA